MGKIARLLFKLLTNSFLLTVFCIVISFFSIEGSFLQSFFGFFAIYGLFATVFVFLLHLFFVIISAAIKDK